MARRRRRRHNPSGLGIGIGLAVAAGVGFAIYQYTRSPGDKAKPGDVVTVPFAKLRIPDLVPIPLDAGGTMARLRVTRVVGAELAGKPEGMLDSAPEVTFARASVVTREASPQNRGPISFLAA